MKNNTMPSGLAIPGINILGGLAGLLVYVVLYSLLSYLSAFVYKSAGGSSEGFVAVAAQIVISVAVYCLSAYGALFVCSLICKSTEKGSKPGVYVLGVLLALVSLASVALMAAKKSFSYTAVGLLLSAALCIYLLLRFGKVKAGVSDNGNEAR